MEPIQIHVNRPGYLILNWSQARMAEIPTIELDPITQREMELHPPTVVSSRHMSPQENRHFVQMDHLLHPMIYMNKGGDGWGE